MREWLPVAVLFGVAGLVFWLATASGPHPTATSPPVRSVDPAVIAGLRAPLLAKLRSSERDVARVRLERMDEDDRFASKVGGAPYLPVGAKVPVSVEGEELFFLAQLNFAELPRMAGFPAAGILQVYICGVGENCAYGLDLGREEFSEASLQQQRYFRIVWFPGPLAPVDELADVAVSDSKGSTPHDPSVPRRMVFELDREEVTARDATFERQIGVVPDDYILAAAARLDVAPDALEEVFATGDGHKVGGYPWFTQADPRHADTELRLLLQLDSDDEIMWGDSGVGNVFIRESDLAASRFDRVMFTWDNY